MKKALSEQQLPGEWNSSESKVMQSNPQMFFCFLLFFFVTLFFPPLFHYKELALWKDVYPKRLHPSRWLGFHGSVIDIVNQRRHTSDKPIGGINNKRTLAAQWVSFSLLYVHTFHLPPSPHAVIPTFILCLRTCKQACPTFIVAFPFFLLEKKHLLDINLLFYWAVNRKKRY